MPRHKSAVNCSILPWLSAKFGAKEKSFIQIGASLFECEKFQELSPATKHLYFCMALEARGKREFSFPQSATIKYGIDPRTLRRAVDKLTEEKIIEVKSSGKITREANIYSFCPDAFTSSIKSI